MREALVEAELAGKAGNSPSAPSWSSMGKWSPVSEPATWRPEPSYITPSSTLSFPGNDALWVTGLQITCVQTTCLLIAR